MDPDRFLYADGDFNLTFGCYSNCTTGALCYDPCFPSSLAPEPNSTSDSDHPSGRIPIHDPNHLLANLLISASAFLALSFLLLLSLYLFLRIRRRRRRRQRSVPLQNPNAVNDAADADEDGFFEDGGGGDHHVWFIRTVGLDETIIASIAAVFYKAGDGLTDGGDCAVCLAEFEDGDAVKLLPKCSHAFHQSCIDTWLRSHVSCPLCRAPVVAPIPEVAGGGGDQVGRELSHSDLVENNQVEVGALNREEVRIEIDSSSGPSLEVPVDLGDSELQPVRRSVSMDSSSLASLLLRVDLEERTADERRDLDLQNERALISKNKGKPGTVSKGDSLRKGPLAMKRSLSSRSGRIFFLRNGHGHGRARSSVLPL